MDLPAILIKITGLILLVWTLFSIYRHVQTKRKAMKENNKERGSICFRADSTTYFCTSGWRFVLFFLLNDGE
jgi:hypothetical protein